MKTKTQTTQVKTYLLCVCMILFGTFAGCEKPIDDPEPTVTELPDTSEEEQEEEEDLNPKLLSKWIYIGSQNGDYLFYDEENYLEFYSDSTYVCHLFGNIQNGSYSMGIEDRYPYLGYYLFSPALDLGSWIDRKHTYIHYYEDQIGFLPDKIQQLLEEMNFPKHVIMFAPVNVACILGCDVYYVAAEDYR